MKFLLIFSIVLLYRGLCDARTTYNCKDGADLYINDPDYDITGCQNIDDHYTITFGPAITTVTPLSEDLNYYGPYEITLSDSVTTIAERAFYYCQHVTIINFGTGLKTIGRSAFTYTNISALYFPDSLITIGDYAFQTCYNLEVVEFNSNLETIGKNAFYADIFGGDLVIPDSVTSIGEFAFAGLSYITSVTIGKGVTRIPLGAFQAIEMQSLTIPDTVEYIDDLAFSFIDVGEFNFGNGLIEIGDMAFWRSKILTDIVLPDSLMWLGDNVFEQLVGVREVTFGANIEEIGAEAFIDSSITSITFNGDALHTIGEYAFAFSRLRSVTFPDNLQHIGNNSFEGCNLLTTIGIPDSVTYIGESAFNNCSALECIYWDDTVNRITGTDAFAYCPLTGCGPSAAPTFRPTALPSVSFSPTFSMAPTRKPSINPTPAPSAKPSTARPTRFDANPKYTFTVGAYIIGIKGKKFTSNIGNNNLFVATVSACMEFDTRVVNITVMNAVSTTVPITPDVDITDIDSELLIFENIANPQLNVTDDDYYYFDDDGNSSFPGGGGGGLPPGGGGGGLPPGGGGGGLPPGGGGGIPGGGGGIPGGGGTNGSTATVATFIVYKIDFIATDEEDASDSFHELKANLFNNTFSGYFTDYLRDHVDDYSASNVMSSCRCVFPYIIKPLSYTPLYGDDDFVDDDVGFSSGSKTSTTTLIIGVVVGVGGFLLVVGGIALLYYLHKPAKVVVTTTAASTTTSKAEVIPVDMSAKETV